MAKHVGILPSAARTADVTSPDIKVAEKYEAAHIVVDITAGSGFNLIFTVKGKDLTSNKSYALLATPTINTTGTTVLRIGPEYTAATNVAKDYIPYIFFVDVTQSGSVSATYSVGGSLI